MNQYSEIVGSFIRNGPFPLEADYIFSTEEELIQFYSETENQSILHQGLFKIVGEGDNQSLYWIIKDGEDLKFKKLLENTDRETIQEWIEEVQRKTNAIIGTEEEDWREYLNTLDYPSITALSEAVSKFLSTVDELDNKINTLPELQNFLEGYNDTDKLSTILEKLITDLQGTPMPSEEFRTFRGIEDFVRLLKSQQKNTDSNLQAELDRTQTGVGLSQDGSFSPDQETYYLRGATSIMNALKILDSNLHSNSIKVSNEVGNQIVIKADGIYHNVDIEVEEGILKVLVNGNTIKTYPLGVSSIVEDGWYDSDLESIIIIFKKIDGTSERVKIPVGALIREWEIDNNNPSKVVELTREEVFAGGADKLSADVRLSTNKNNILEKDGNTLLVRGTTDNITHEGRNLDKVLNDLKGIRNVFDYYSEALEANLGVGNYFLVLNDETQENEEEDSPESTDTIYNLVTNVSNVKDNGQYIFAYNNYVMSQPDEKNQYRTYEEVGNNGNSMIIPIDNDTIQEVTFIKGTVGYYLQVGDDQYLTVNGFSDSQNYLGTSSLEDASEFIFYMNSDTTFHISSSNTNGTEKFLQFNATKNSERFTCYRTGSQKDFNLYIRESARKELVFYPKGLYIITDYGIERIPFYGAINELTNLLNRETQSRMLEDSKLQHSIESMNATINKIKTWYEAD